MSATLPMKILNVEKHVNRHDGREAFRMDYCLNDDVVRISWFWSRDELAAYFLALFSQGEKRQ